MKATSSNAQDPLSSIWPHLKPLGLTPQVRAEADDAVNGVVWFRFQGEHRTTVGHRDVDWSGGHRKHQEWPAQLNRFFMLRPLIAAWHHTRDEQYAGAARDYIEDWIRANPPREEWTIKPGDNTLTLSIRIGNSSFLGWGGALFAFAGSKAFDDAFKARVLASIEVQLNYLLNNLTAHGNWRISQADTLVSTAVRFPQLSSAVKWRERGVELINEAVSEQFLPDGVHIERTPGYHNWMARVLDYYWRLGHALPEFGVEIDADLVRRAYEYSLASIRPNGESNRLHDSSGKVNEAALRERYNELLRDAALPQNGQAQPAHFFPHAGQVLLRSSAARDADYVTFDATPYSMGHWHASINAIQVDVAGRPILVDPGILDYERTNPMMAYGKSTRAHSTVNFNGWNQAPVSQVQTEYSSAPGYDYVSSKYDGGYWASKYNWVYVDGLQHGLWASHHRQLLWAHGRYIVVVDHVVHRPAPNSEPFVECNWQFERGEIHLDAERGEAVTKNPDANLLLRVLSQPKNTRLHLHEGETEPSRGWTAGGDRVATAPQISVRSENLSWTHATKFVTLLAPFLGTTPPNMQAQFVEGSKERVIQIQTPEYSDIVFLDATPFRFSYNGFRFRGSAGVLHGQNGENRSWTADR